MNATESLFPLQRPLLSPSILSADFAKLGDECQEVLDTGKHWLHVDVMDGQFVPNISIGLPIVKALRRRFPDTTLDVHLMVDEPIRYVEDFIKQGADIVTVHAEACTHLHRTIEAIRAAGAHPGVALNPATPLSALEYVLEEVDMVLVMSVNPGFGGQSFIPSALDKIHALRQEIIRRRLEISIEVDGGIKAHNIAQVREAGADVFVAGSAVFGPEDRARAIADLQKGLEI